MTETASLARPYVRAVFEVASADDELAAWSERLALLEAVARDPRIAGLDGHPRVDRDELARLVIDVCGERLNAKGRNLVRLLARNRRLSALAEIVAQYEALRAAAQNRVEAVLETAGAIDDARRERIAEALKDRLGCEVRLDCRINPEILGGAVIRAGDRVYDDSIRSRLQKMAAALGA